MGHIADAVRVSPFAPTKDFALLGVSAGPNFSPEIGANSNPKSAQEQIRGAFLRRCATPVHPLQQITPGFRGARLPRTPAQWAIPGLLTCPCRHGAGFVKLAHGSRRPNCRFSRVSGFFSVLRRFPRPCTDRGSQTADFRKYQAFFPT